jgi:hypothetical protein
LSFEKTNKSIGCLAPAEGVGRNDKVKPFGSKVID